MKCIIPEISWHNRDPVLSVDIQCKMGNESFYRLASGGTDSHVLIWHLSVETKGEVKLEWVCDLTRHQKAVNCVKFSPSGEFLASADDESHIIIWKQRTDADPPELDKDENDTPGELSSEQWTLVRTLRGHLDDVYDLSWSPDSIHLVSGSVDNTAVIWDVHKGKKVVVCPEAKNFVQGVSWDPENKFVATLSSDSKCRVYDWRSHQLLFTTNRGKHGFGVSSTSTAGGEDKGKPIKLFHDDTLKTFFRRLQFSPDGQLLAAPSGIISQSSSSETTVKPKNCSWLFARKHLNNAILCYPHGNEPSMVTRWCPVRFALRPDVKSILALPYRMVLAVATKASIILYDTQYAVPIGHISNIHYTKLTDLTWSSDGKVIVASSTDGYCSVITFTDGELGTPYESNSVPMECAAG